MLDYQLRVVNELDELTVKLEALNSFIESRSFVSLLEQDKLTLELQAKVMAQYADILGTRISRF